MFTIWPHLKCAEMFTNRAQKRIVSMKMYMKRLSVCSSFVLRRNAGICGILAFSPIHSSLSFVLKVMSSAFFFRLIFSVYSVFDQTKTKTIKLLMMMMMIRSLATDKRCDFYLNAIWFACVWYLADKTGSTLFKLMIQPLRGCGP